MYTELTQSKWFSKWNANQYRDVRTVRIINRIAKKISMKSTTVIIINNNFMNIICFIIHSNIYLDTRSIIPVESSRRMFPFEFHSKPCESWSTWVKHLYQTNVNIHRWNCYFYSATKQFTCCLYPTIIWIGATEI